MPPLPPWVRILKGEPVIPQQPHRLQGIGHSLLWATIVVLPLALLALHWVTRGFGLDTLMLMVVWAVWILVSQVVLGVAASLYAPAFTTRAIGTRAAGTSFAYYGCWLLVPITMPDATAALEGRPRLPSPAEQVFGGPANTVVFPALILVGLALWLTTLVFIILDGRRARRDAVAAHLVASRAGQGSPEAEPPPLGLVRNLDGRPGIPQPPKRIESAGYILVWVAIIFLPLAVVAIRLFVTGLGIYALVLAVPALVAIVGGQVVMGGLATEQSSGFSARAMGTRAVGCSLLYYGCWLLLPLTVSDGNPMTSESSLSPIEQQFGEGVAEASFWAVAGVGVAFYVATLVFIWLDGARARHRAIAAHHEWFGAGHSAGG